MWKLLYDVPWALEEITKSFLAMYTKLSFILSNMYTHVSEFTKKGFSDYRQKNYKMIASRHKIGIAVKNLKQL